MDVNTPIIVKPPLKGEWVAINTPGDKIPSHGTDSLGQRYAYDFFQIDSQSGRKQKFYKSNDLIYRLKGVGLQDCYCYKQPIFSPVKGQVVVAKDGVKEPGRLHPFWDFTKMVLRTIYATIQGLMLPVDKINLHKLIGNYIIINFDNYYAFFAHISTGTITVREGQNIEIGEKLGEVGHTGNSTAPHLHFHVMDSPDLLTAKGVLCVFESYKQFTGQGWKEIKNGIPKSDHRILFT